MARRNLEQALQAGQRIKQGLDLRFTQLRIINEHKFDSSYGNICSLQYSFGRNISDVFLAVGFESSAIRLYDALTGNFIRELRKPRYGGEMHIMCIKFHPLEGRTHLLYASTADGKIYCYDTTEEEPNDKADPVITEEGNVIFSMDFADKGRELITCGSDLSVRLYNSITHERDRCWEGYNISSQSDKLATTSMRLFSLKCHPLNDEIFITGGWDNHVKIWHSKSNEPVKRVISGPHIVAEGIDIKGFEATNQAQILTASDTAKDALQIWNYSTGELLDTVPFHYTGCQGAYLYCAQFCDNDVVIAGGRGTNSMQAIDCQERKVIGEIKFKAPVYCLDSIFGGRRLAVGSKDRTLVLGELC